MSHGGSQTGTGNASLLTRAAVVLALLVFGLSAWTLIADLPEHGGSPDGFELIGRLESLQAAVEALERESRTEETPARRWNELFSVYRREAGELDLNQDADLGEGVDYLLRAYSYVSQAEEMRNSLLLSQLGEEQRESLENEFRATVSLAVADIRRLAGKPRNTAARSDFERQRELTAHRVAVCLLSLLAAALLLVQEVGVVRRRRRRDPELRAPPDLEQTAEAAPSPSMELAERLAGRVALCFDHYLMAVNGYCELLLNSVAADDPLRADLNEIRSAGERAAVLSRQLRAFSRNQSSQPILLDLNTLIRGCDSSLRPLLGGDIDLTTELEAGSCMVEADPEQIGQILENLAVNAREAMPAGGALSIRTFSVPGDPDGGFVLLELRDTGRGMDDETRSRLFEPFYTTKPPGRGTGLGLTTVEGIVSSIGGSIEVVSEPGKGTAVRIYLPRFVEPAATEPASIEVRAAHA